MAADTMESAKSGGKPALLMSSCETLQVTDHERVSCGLHLASRGLSSALAAAAEPFGLNGMEANLLLKLHIGFDSPSEIATYLGIDASNLSRLMRRLESSNLLRRSVDESNRSRVIISLTPKGKKLASKLKPAVREMEQRVMSALSAQELKTLQKLLKKMCTELLEN